MTDEPVGRMPDPKYAEALAESRQDAEFWEQKEDALRTALAQLDEARAERDELRAAVMGGDPDPRLKHGNFLEMARDLHRAQEGGLARAEAAEARLEEQEASWRETLRIERDARLNENRLKMKATARLEEAKAVLEALLNEIESGIDPLDHRHDRKRYDKARAFLHQGGSDAR